VNPLKPLRDRDFRLYFFGELISFTGSGFSLVAINWYLLDRTGSTALVALLYAVALGAGLVAFPLAGPLSDRYPRRQIVILADLLRFCSIGLLALLAFAGDPPLPVIYVLMAITGFGFSLFFSAILAFLQEIVSADDLVVASGLSEITAQFGNLTGAALAGAFYVRYGLAWALAVDAISYIVSALCLWLVRHRSLPAGAGMAWGELVREGIAYLSAHKPVAGFGMLALLPGVATVSLNVVAVAYVLDVMDQDATVYGLTDMCYGVGAMVSGFLGGLLVVRFGRWSALTACLLLPLAVYLTFVLGPTGVPFVLVLSALAGFGSSAFRVIAQSVLLALVPSAVMGRATAVFGLSSTLVQVAVALMVGLVMEAWGAQAGFAVLAGVIGICLAGVLTVVPGVRRLAEAA